MTGEQASAAALLACPVTGFGSFRLAALAQRNMLALMQRLKEQSPADYRKAKEAAGPFLHSVFRTLPFVLLLTFPSFGLSPAMAAPPNFVLVMADDQGWGDMAYNGRTDLKTPNFDRFAREGIRFDNFHSAAPVCSPTRGSVLTGRTPNRYACFSWGHPIRPQEITLAHLLRQSGYRTGHFGKWHLGSVLTGGRSTPGEAGFDAWVSAPNFFDLDPILSDRGQARKF